MNKSASSKITYNLFAANKEATLKDLGKSSLVATLEKMLLIRHFEIRAESAYQHGKVGGFFHAYLGQEAIQTACVDLLGESAWYIGTYRCHALALLLGVDPKEAMAELYGKANGNAMGRGGSMHLYSDRLLGGFGIVGGHLPIALGAAFSMKYQKKSDIAVCFLGDGSVAQGLFHESLNLGSLWNIPCLYVIENNKWGMGTGVERAIAKQPIAESLAPGYGLEAYSVDGLDYLSCYGCFKEAVEKIKKDNKPIVIEALTERFRGHSISDPGLYRSKEELKKIQGNDPILHLKELLLEKKFLTNDQFDEIDGKVKSIVIDSMKYADESPYPDVSTLEEGVFHD